jgi:ribosome-associated protein
LKSNGIGWQNAVMSQHLDGSGKPFITLAQFLKVQEWVSSGGEAKARVRAGLVTVNAEPEQRPGRKLHAGDVVGFSGQTASVELAP